MLGALAFMAGPWGIGVKGQRSALRGQVKEEATALVLRAL